RFYGVGSLNADFASNTLSIDGQIKYTEDYIVVGTPYTRGEATGTFSGSANISSTANNFTGPITLTGIGPYSGTMFGRFFGPTAEEVGATFSATDGAGGALAGTFAGGLDAAAAPPSAATIASLTAPTSFTYQSTEDDVASISYDPTSSTYTFTFTDP